MKDLFRSLFLVLTVAAAAVFLPACAKKEPEISHSTLEDTRSRSRANALWNLQLYRAENPRFDGDFKIVSHADESITPDCPQGDGWAALSLMKVDPTDAKKIEKYKVLCSTTSQSLGCYLESDFAKKPFSGDEGHCQPLTKVPHPLPVLAK